MMAKLRTPLTSADHIIGEEIAAATLVEYGDYQCPFCAAAHSVVQQILSRCGNNLRFAFRHFPLTDMHPSAEPAAEVAEVAGRHGLFWPMHDSIYANQQRVSVPLLIALAANMELSSIELRDALTNHRLLSKIQCDFAGGVRSGVNGTPAFFINGLRFDGPLGAAGLPAAIEAVLDASGATTKVDSPRRVTATCKTESLQTSPRTPTVKAGKGSIMTVATRLQALQQRSGGVKVRAELIAARPRPSSWPPPWPSPDLCVQPVRREFTLWWSISKPSIMAFKSQSFWAGRWRTTRTRRSVCSRTWSLRRITRCSASSRPEPSSV
jgi:protein-disulfide isomerase